MRNQLNIKLGGDILDALKVYAASVGLTPSEVARVAIGEYMRRNISITAPEGHEDHASRLLEQRRKAAERARRVEKVTADNDSAVFCRYCQDRGPLDPAEATFVKITSPNGNTDVAALCPGHKDYGLKMLAHFGEVAPATFEDYKAELSRMRQKAREAMEKAKEGEKK